jgi:uncharacterized protein (TIGR03000 family)
VPYRRISCALAALGLAGLVLTPRLALGQDTGGYYYETYRYGYNPGYYARRYAAPPGVGPRTAKQTASSGVYVYFVPAPGVSQLGGNGPLRVTTRMGAVGQPVPADTSAQIEVKVPQTAEVWFDGEKTTQTGSLRRFLTPPLTAGAKYSYEVRVVWKDGAGELTETRRLSFSAGETLSAVFPAAVASSEVAGPAQPAPSTPTGR